MNKTSKVKGVAIAVVMFVLVMTMLFTVGVIIQTKLGLWGVLCTELIFLAMALAGALIMKVPFREMFPVHKPKLRKVFGSLVLWMAGLLLALFCTLVVGYFFPEQMGETSSGLNSVITSLPFGIAFLIVAVSPAICEESIHRGFMLYYAKSLEKKWLIVLFGGFMFGLFHADPTRFLATAILGAAITYVVVETGNMFYGFLIHLVNNTYSLLAALFSQSVLESAGEDAAEAISSGAAFNLTTVSGYMIVICVVPWLIWLGTSLMKDKKAAQESKPTGMSTVKKVVICLVISGLCVGGGVVGLAGSLLAGGMYTTGAQVHTAGDLVKEPFSANFEIKEGTTGQQLTAVMNTGEGLFHVYIEDEDDNVAYEFTAKEMTGNLNPELEPGTYELRVEMEDADASSDAQATFQIIIMSR